MVPKLHSVLEVRSHSAEQDSSLHLTVKEITLITQLITEGVHEWHILENINYIWSTTYLKSYNYWLLSASNHIYTHTHNIFMCIFFFKDRYMLYIFLYLYVCVYIYFKDRQLWTEFLQFPTTGKGNNHSRSVYPYSLFTGGRSLLWFGSTVAEFLGVFFFFVGVFVFAFCELAFSQINVSLLWQQLHPFILHSLGWTDKTSTSSS